MEDTTILGTESDNTLSVDLVEVEGTHAVAELEDTRSHSMSSSAGLAKANCTHFGNGEDLDPLR